MTLPNFLVIGGAKCSTTSLYHYLRQHPDIFMSPIKEPRYFGSGPRPVTPAPVRTRDAYERLFSRVTTERAIGEASPQYLHSADAVDRIAAELPAGVRFIVSIRNPADRAYSSYLGRRAGGAETCSVGEAMRPGSFYFMTSLYHDALQSYINRFGRDRVKIILFDDVVSDAAGTVQDLFEFLRVTRNFSPDVTKRHGRAVSPRWFGLNAMFVKAATVASNLLPPKMRQSGLANRFQRAFLLGRAQPIPDHIRKTLLAQFEPDIRATEELIGRSLSHWLEPAC